MPAGPFNFTCDLSHRAKIYSNISVDIGTASNIINSFKSAKILAMEVKSS